MKKAQSIMKLRYRSPKGSAMIAIIIMTTMMFAILGSFLPSTMTEVKVNYQDSHAKTSLLLAEAGLEDCIWSLNNNKTEDSWISAGWTKSGNNNYFYRTIDLANESYNLAGNYKGKIQLVAANPFNANVGDDIKILCKGIVTKSDSGEILARRILSLDVHYRSPFRGIIAKDVLVIDGTPNFRSYNSNQAPYAYNALSNSTNKVTVGSVSDAVDSVTIKNAVIDGDVVSGAFSPVGDGAVVIGDSASVTGSVIEGYSYDFPDVEEPDTTGWATSF